MPDASPDKIRLAWVKYLLALRGYTMTDAARQAGLRIGAVSHVVAGRRGSSIEFQAPTAEPVWTALTALSGMPLAVLQHPPRTIPPDLARELEALARAG